MLLKRVITGSVLILLVIATFLLRRIDVRFFSAFIFVCSLFGTIEMLRAFGNRITLAQKIIVSAFAVIFAPIYVFTNNAQASLLTAFVAIVLCLLLLVFQFESTSLESVGFSAIAVVYPTLVLFPVLVMNGKGALSFPCLMLVFIVAPCSDTLAYIVGSIVKGKKMAEKISPKKTISGGIGGIIGGFLGATIFCLCYSRNNLIFDYFWQDLLLYAFIGLVGGFVTEIGDLVEGAIKRKVGIKDMGNILPGHGGVLDRIDGIMINSLFVSLVFLFLV
ncbi:MAG: phosphatidate cytidylyltransferase [Christensenellaceae bacterium]